MLVWVDPQVADAPAYRRGHDRSIDSLAAIMGQFSGGPGLSFSLPASSGLVGATLVVLLRDRDEHGEARKHAYQLVPLDLTNEMQYHGELG